MTLFINITLILFVKGVVNKCVNGKHEKWNHQFKDIVEEV